MKKKKVESICWQCESFRAIADGKGMKLDCDSLAKKKWTREHGFVAINCTQYRRDLK